MRKSRVASASVCRECPAFGVCTRNASAGRTLEIGPYDLALRRHRNWMATDEAKQAYLRRLPLIERALRHHQEPTRCAALRAPAGHCQREGRMEPACHSLQSTDSSGGCGVSELRPARPSSESDKRRRLASHTSERHHPDQAVPTRKILMALRLWHQSSTQYFIDQLPASDLQLTYETGTIMDHEGGSTV